MKRSVALILLLSCLAIALAGCGAVRRYADDIFYHMKFKRIDSMAEETHQQSIH